MPCCGSCNLCFNHSLYKNGICVCRTRQLCTSASAGAPATECLWPGRFMFSSSHAGCWGPEIILKENLQSLQKHPISNPQALSSHPGFPRQFAGQHPLSHVGASHQFFCAVISAEKHSWSMHSMHPTNNSCALPAANQPACIHICVQREITYKSRASSHISPPRAKWKIQPSWNAAIAVCCVSMCPSVSRAAFEPHWEDARPKTQQY